MEASTIPVHTDLVLIGGGHSHVFVLRKFGMDPMPGVRLTVICRDVHAPYSGMLPGLIAGHYEFDEAHIDLVTLARFAGARFLHAEVTGLDLERRQVTCRDRPPIAFDLLSINIGSQPGMAHVQGADASVVAVKPIDGFARRWSVLRERVLARREETTLAFVGGGAGGVEMLLAIQHNLQNALAADGRTDDHLRYQLYTASSEVLHTHNPSVRRRFLRVLAERGVAVETDYRVVSVSRGNDVQLTFANGTTARADEVFWVTTAAAQQWPAAAGLEVDERGFIKVGETLQTLTDPRVFAAGDVAAVEGHPRPKAGVFAVRQGPPLTRNLRRAARGEAPLPFRPQREFLSLISTGDRYAVASRSWWSVEGRWVWRWKDRIDRLFMRKFCDLPAMEGTASGTTEPGTPENLAPLHCAGCGSKVGGRVLRRALARLDLPQSDDVLVGLESPDDAAVVRLPEGRVAVYTVDHFRALVVDPFVFGRITAVHALGDLWAMGATPQSAMAIVTLAYATEAKMEEDLVQLLAGACEVFAEAGTTLVGGHTSEGPEMALGFALTGHATPSELLHKSGLAVGDALVLTKPLGTGALFAAEMRGRAKGRWIVGAVESMSQPSDRAAVVLRAHGATAMTDVTGFGLAGHLGEMLAASARGARIALVDVPLLAGASEVAASGIASSLQPQNRHVESLFAVAANLSESPAYALLFDPQTAGGLLAGIPGERALEAVVALRQAGYADAAVIGEVSGAERRIEIV